MRVTGSTELNASIEDCWAMFLDPQSHVQKFAAMGHREIEIVECDADDDHIRLVIDRLVDLDLPSFARKMFHPTNHVRSTDEWFRKDATTCAGTFVMETRGVPLEVSGATLLGSGDTRCDYSIDIDVEIRVPILGRRLAPFAKGIVEQQLAAEFSQAAAWVTVH